MGIPIIVYGKSGSGKSSSLRNLGANEYFYANVESKPLPFRSKPEYEWRPPQSSDKNDVSTIMTGLSKMPTKIAVIDDAGYLMTHTFMRNHRSMKGNAQFDMYNEIADDIFRLIQYIKNALPDDVTVYLIFHEDTNDFNVTRIKTIGKLLDDKVCLEGMVTICIRCMTVDGAHIFSLVTDGNDITKTPIDMFTVDTMDNDLKAVDTTIREYYGFNNKKKEKK